MKKIEGLKILNFGDTPEAYDAIFYRLRRQGAHVYNVDITDLAEEHFSVDQYDFDFAVVEMSPKVSEASSEIIREMRSRMVPTMALAADTPFAHQYLEHGVPVALLGFKPETFNRGAR